MTNRGDFVHYIGCGIRYGHELCLLVGCPCACHLAANASEVHSGHTTDAEEQPMTDNKPTASDREAPAWTLDDAAVKAGRAAATARVAARKIGAELQRVAERQKAVNAFVADVVKEGATLEDIQAGLKLARAEVLRVVALRRMREERRG